MSVSGSSSPLGAGRAGELDRSATGGRTGSVLAEPRGMFACCDPWWPGRAGVAIRPRSVADVTIQSSRRTRGGGVLSLAVGDGATNGLDTWIDRGTDRHRRGDAGVAPVPQARGDVLDFRPGLAGRAVPQAGRRGAVGPGVIGRVDRRRPAFRAGGRLIRGGSDGGGHGARASRTVALWEGG